VASSLKTTLNGGIGGNITSRIKPNRAALALTAAVTIPIAAGSAITNPGGD